MKKRRDLGIEREAHTRPMGMNEADLGVFERSIRVALEVEGSFVELGVKRAKGLHNLARVLREEKAERLIVGVELIPMGLPELIAARVAPFLGGNDLRMIYGSTLEVAAEFRREPIAWCYVDACHCFDCARDDIDTWGRLVTAGGYLVAHDTGVANYDMKARCPRGVASARLGRSMRYIAAREACDSSRVLRSMFELREENDGDGSLGVRVYRKRRISEPALG